MITFIARIMNQLMMGHLKPPTLRKDIPKTLVYSVPFRCWPIDMDMFIHMNNASYLRVAELARWRIFPQTGAIELTRKRGILFLVVSQQASYLKQLPALKNFEVETKVTVADNKWLHYTHTFQKPPKAGQDPYIYAVVECKAVLKEKSGKTVRLTEISKDSEFYKHLAPDVEGSESSTN